jgi:drug/metabolite transporter (DMT)-like permease
VQARRVALLEVMLVSQGVGLIGLLVLLSVRGTGPPELTRLLPAIFAGIGGIVGLTAFYRALAIGTMSIVAPIASTGVVVPVVVGIAQGEAPAALQVVGIVAAVVGVVLASREHGPGLDESPPPDRQQNCRQSRPGGEHRGAGGAGSVGSASIALALIAALGFGGFFVGLRSSARADVPWALTAARGAGVAVLLLAAAIRRPAPIRGDRLTLAALAVMGVLDLGANALYALATRHGLLSVVSVASSLYPVATVILARLVLGERVRRIQEVGIVSALAGVALIAAG